MIKPVEVTWFRELVMPVNETAGEKRRLSRLRKPFVLGLRSHAHARKMPNGVM